MKLRTYNSNRGLSLDLTLVNIKFNLALTLSKD